MAKNWNTKQLKIEFQQSGVNPKCSRDKRTILPHFLSLSPIKSYYWNVFSHICGNVSKQNLFDKPVFNNVSRLNHSSPTNDTVANKIKPFLQLFALGPEIALIRKWHYFLPWSTITIKLDIYVCTYKNDYIGKDLLQAICLLTINFWLNFVLEINVSACIKFWCHNLD